MEKADNKEAGRISERRNVKKLLNGDISAVLYEDEAMIRGLSGYYEQLVSKGKATKNQDIR